jgi:hypothetical protein
MIRVPLHYTSTQNPSGTSASTSVEPPRQVGSSTVRQSVQAIGNLPNASNQSSNTSASNPTTTVQYQQLSADPLHDYMLLCSDEKGWLTTREDMDVTEIKSDRQLFDTFRSRIANRRRWTHRFVSLRSIQHISFVKVSGSSCISCNICNK